MLKTEQKECINCHRLFNLPYNEQNKKICPNCVSVLSANNIQKKEEPKYEMSAREYFEQNKDRYFMDEDYNNKIRNSSLKTRRLNRIRLEMPICSKCKKTYDPKNNKRFYFCNNCNNYLCGNCSKNHYLQFPDHKCSQSINNNNYNNNNNNYNNNYNNNNNYNEINSKKYMNTEVYNTNLNRNPIEPLRMCMSCGIEKKEYANKNFIECPICRKTFCDSCSIKHYRLNQTHSQPMNNSYNTNLPNRQPIKEEKCIICGIIHRNSPMRIFYDCNACKGCICILCKKIHDSKFYNHKLFNPRKYDNRQIIKSNNNIDYNNTDINKGQNKEEIKKGIYTIYGEVVCYLCKRNFDQFYYCNKCMRLYCIQCNINYHKCNF